MRISYSPVRPYVHGDHEVKIYWIAGIGAWFTLAAYTKRSLEPNAGEKSCGNRGPTDIGYHNVNLSYHYMDSQPRCNETEIPGSSWHMIRNYRQFPVVMLA